MAEWKESEHPRDNAGRFTDKEGSSSSYRDEVNERIKWAKENNVELPLNDDGSLNDIRLQKLYNEKKEVAEKLGTTASSTVRFSSPSASDFRNMFLAAREAQPECDRWRVSADYSETDYEGMQRYSTEGGSTYATHDGDIVSVCRNPSDNARGSDLLADAVKNGGDRLDAFGPKLFGFYQRNGFEPVSWTLFNPDFAPEGWKPEYGTEPVIFYKYVGKGKTSSVSYSDFIERTKPCEDSNGEFGYDIAKKLRDESIGKK